MTIDIYEWADNSINSTPRYATGFTELLATNPYRMPSGARYLYESRLLSIRSFQKIAVDIFRAALKDEMHPIILHWLINETPYSIGLPYHRHLEERHFTLPVFFRTDEVKPGRINEIQCPGSLWGELQLAYDYAVEMGFVGSEESPANQFSTQLTAMLQDAPLVHHLFDNASAPAGVRYFIEKTRPRLKYWSIDRGVRRDDCNFVRAQCFYSLCSDDYLTPRLIKMGSGVAYDLPPHILFDNKSTLILPFWSMTRDLFTDDIRDILLFTTPLLPTGIELPNGACVTAEEFSRWPRSQRSYYLKYAGSDPTLSWGSKAVYRLSNMSSAACLDLLRQCLNRYERGQIWVLQEEEAQDDEITYLTRDGTVHTQSLRAKLSGFYGPDSCLGVLAMHRHFNKVHGQEDTVLSYVRADAGKPHFSS